MHNAPPSNHPLQVPWAHFTGISHKVLMIGIALETVGHSLESAVSMVWETPRQFGFIELKEEEGIIVLEVFVADNP